MDDQANPPFDYNMLQWQAAEIQLNNGIFQVTLQPNRNMANFSQASLDSFASACREINAKGIPIMLRYGHEMNGDWTSYGVRPVNYVTGFRRMAQAIRRATNLTGTLFILMRVAMVWGPNVGINYPFQGGGNPYPTNITDPENFRALDTNNDGVIDWRDDPYLPYYPGDDVVDWVAVSLYWYPSTEYNGPVFPTFFRDNLVGSGPAIEAFNPVVANDGGLRNFYQRFAVERDKPLMVPETGSPWFPDHVATATRTELEVKTQWWNQIYNRETFAQFPRIKAIAQFEEMKVDGHGGMRDWRVLYNPAVAAAFRETCNNLRDVLVFAQQLDYSCGGGVRVK